MNYNFAYKDKKVILIFLENLWRKIAFRLDD